MTYTLNHDTVYVVTVDVTKLQPRAVLNGGKLLIFQFVEHHEDNLPDISEKPDIPPSLVQFWMMDDKGHINPKKRFPKPHSRLPGMRGQHTNRAIDFAISLNKVPVCFKDDDGVTINLVDGCMILVWLNYISQLRGHPMPEANACQMILKYMLLNREAFVKAFHDRMYYYSSGTKFLEVSTELSKWMTRQDKLHAAPEDPVRIHPLTHPSTH